MTEAGYVFDYTAMVSWTASTAPERVRQRLTQYVVDALRGGAPAHFPVLCLAAADRVRPGIIVHVAGLVRDAPVGTVVISEITLPVAVGMADIARRRTELTWPAVQAAYEATAHSPDGDPLHGWAIVTTDPEGAGYDQTLKWIAL